MPKGQRHRGGRGGRWSIADRSGEAYPQRIRGFVEPALLLLLHMGPRHGYGLKEGLQMVGFGNYPVDSSAIYRILRQLETAGMVSSRWDTESTAGPPRRVYCLTEAGDQYLAAWVGDLRATDSILHRFLDAYDLHMKDDNGEHSK